MSELVSARRTSLLVAGALVAIVTLAIFRIPESFVAQIENSGPLSLSERGWAFRLLAFFAIVQAFYVGWSVLRAERVKRARENEARVTKLSRVALVRSLARSSAGAMVLTLIYGIAAFSATGFRSGFWLFTVLALAQGAWYYRQTGEIARWLGFQPETIAPTRTRGAWVAAPPDYSPPIARGLQPSEVQPPGAR